MNAIMFSPSQYKSVTLKDTVYLGGMDNIFENTERIFSKDRL